MVSAYQKSVACDGWGQLDRVWFIWRLRCDIQLMTKDDDFLEQLKLHGPAIRHTLLMLLSEQDGKKIKTPDGKEALRKQAVEAVSTLMKDLAGKDSLEALYFTTFFVQ
ncbi:MAG: hypothetical protein DIZ77_01175 [endosymbiont of Seepiophila jonesi]|uniref:Flagellar protein FliL n=1 Tax=endosymbiont of Lamellibrachia luymesi TaxID=2200907 RepID=A0A370DZG7_9GAMM|nr:MAG: hypothetical protein DIZ79_08305 [endosymbiont of Lamellibrachia luymesi]RDH94444.1 MAG: hypothetical protein DIZ77_01175 [endosymbiont of Seepiophila jonesi]